MYFKVDMENLKINKGKRQIYRLIIVYQLHIGTDAHRNIVLQLYFLRIF